MFGKEKKIIIPEPVRKEIKKRPELKPIKPVKENKNTYTPEFPEEELQDRIKKYYLFVKTKNKTDDKIKPTINKNP